jgi:hypothetical protein
LLIALLAAAALVAATGEVRAQAAGSPAGHWGLLAYPELNRTHQIGLQQMLFTEYGKPGDGRYGDFGNMQTMGINLITLSNTRQLARRSSLDGNLLYTSTLNIGASWDWPTEFLQNDVRHNMSNLEFVPRGRTRTAPELIYGGEFVYRVFSHSHTDTGFVDRTPTPFFILAGFQVGSLSQEGYVGAGVRRLDNQYLLSPAVRRFFALSVSAMARLGVPVPGFAFQHTAHSYSLAQVSGAVHLFEAFYPIVVEFGWTGHTGIFIDKERRPMPEKYWTFHLSFGPFNFEVSNDSMGDKDIGPTVGLRAIYSVSPGTNFLHNLLDVL